MRALIRLAAWLLLASSLPLAGLFALTPRGQLTQQIHQLNYGFNGEATPVALTAGRYQLLQLGLAAGVGLALLGLLATRRPAASPRRRARWVGPGRRSLLAAWRAQAPAEQALAAGLLLAVAGVRLYYAGYYPLSLDEIYSYDTSVLSGPAVTASYYPLPNNHLLANLLAGLVHALWPAAAPPLALRLLPTLAGLLALPLTYALSLRYLRPPVAALGWGLFWLSPLAVYYAVVGRGYAWGSLAFVVGLGAVLALLQPRPLAGPRRRAAWVALGASSLVGLYAVPTYSWVLAGLELALVVGLPYGPTPRRRWWRLLLQLGVLNLGLGLSALLLYAPVGCVTGWPALLANPYVARHAWPEFWGGFGPFMVGTATELLGQRGLSALAYAGLLGAAPLALRWGKLPAPTRRLGWVLYAQYGLWLPLTVAQGVYPPARVLLLVLLAFFVLAALVGEALLARYLRAAYRGAPRPLPGVLLVALLLAGYGGYRLRREQVIVQAQQQRQAALRQVYQWLRQAPQPWRRVWVAPRDAGIVLHHLALTAGPLPLALTEDTTRQHAGPVGEVQVLETARLPVGWVTLPLYQAGAYVVVPATRTCPLVQPEP